ncbi:MAG: Si-specific NAD(P)(+) transhydrogenase [Myxococcales bacterium]|nr:Si-specific NAD(P)(+) transhydrogenase [Myxococcales bacterium]
MERRNYDLVVIGSGPAGQKGAICAAKLGKKVCVIDHHDRIGGVSLHTGTIPSKTLREAVLYLSGFRQRQFYGKHYRVKDQISVADLAKRVRPVLQHEVEVVRSQLQRNGIEIVHGLANFVDANTLDVEGSKGKIRVHGDRVLVACGTRPAHPPEIPIDGQRVFNSDQLAKVAEIPRHLIVVGAGVIGLEYACMLTALGGEVTIIEGRKTFLDFVDQELVEALTYHMRRHGVTFRLGEKVVSVRAEDQVIAELDSGKTVQADALLYSVGRQGNADRLGLDAAGLTCDARGRIAVNEFLQTAVPHIYAAGDVIGFPSLASASMEQGRLASCHMFGMPSPLAMGLLPYGIYTIPELSMVGKNEQELTAGRIPYEVGIARFEELAKAQMIGDQIGVCKLLFDPKSLKLLGVHVLGDQAAEIIHIGQAVLSLGATIEYFRDTVFNYPTLAEAYKVAALDGLNKIRR